jgi:hypothetical protein
MVSRQTDCIAYMASTAGLIGGRPGGGVPRPVLQACSMTRLGPEHADGGGAASERLQLVLLVTCGSGGAVLGGAGRTVSRWWRRGAAGEEAPQSQSQCTCCTDMAALRFLPRSTSLSVSGLVAAAVADVRVASAIEYARGERDVVYMVWSILYLYGMQYAGYTWLDMGCRGP